MKIGISGACGRMGTAIGRLALEDRRLRIAEAMAAPGARELGRDYGTVLGRGSIGVFVADRFSGRADVLIDFSTPEGALARLEECLRLRTPAVVGTTGFTAAQRRAIERAGRKLPVVLSSNLSVGVNVLFRVAAEAAALLGDGYDLDIVETHHRFKKDAPSGTAKTLAERVERATGRKVRIASVRSGDVVGEHRMIYGSIGDSIEIVHRANSRDIFAKGALRAAVWVARAKPGLYAMADVLGIDR